MRKRTEEIRLENELWRRAVDEFRAAYAYVIQKVAEAWEAKIEDESLAVHGVRVAQVFRDYGCRTSSPSSVSRRKWPRSDGKSLMI